MYTDQEKWQAASDRTDAALVAYRRVCSNAAAAGAEGIDMAGILAEVEASFAAFAELCSARGGHGKSERPAFWDAAEKLW